MIGLNRATVVWSIDIIAIKKRLVGQTNGLKDKSESEHFFPQFTLQHWDWDDWFWVYGGPTVCSINMTVTVTIQDL